MQFHYALVDDLVSREEFERRVEEKILDCGNLVDELSAALLVVGDLGRQHVKIQGLSGKSSLFSFFGKVIEKSDPREFDRADGEKGLVASILLGDETGETRIVLWDEKAMAVHEIEVGDVLEIIGKPGKRQGDIMALALRKATCEIQCRSNPVSLHQPPAERLNLPVKLLAISEPVSFTRKDGSPGERQEAIIGDPAGTARLVIWTPGVLDDIPPGSSVLIENVVNRSHPPAREFSLDEKSMVTPLDTPIEVVLPGIADIGDEGIYSIHGIVCDETPQKTFTTRDGQRSFVRNILLQDSSGKIRVVLWGDHAGREIYPGDSVSVYNATAKTGRTGNRELSAGRTSSISVDSYPDAQEIEFQGTIIAGAGGTWIDNGSTTYRIEGDFPAGREVRVRGILRGHTITPDSFGGVELLPGPLLERCRKFLG